MVPASFVLNDQIVPRWLEPRQLSPQLLLSPLKLVNANTDWSLSDDSFTPHMNM